MTHFRLLPALALLLVLLALGGCGKRAPAGHFALVIGSEGHTSGHFNRPRGVYFDTPHDLLYVVDWDGRIQKFTGAGEFRASWIMPLIEKGKPEDLCIGANGNLLVTDTHYSRIVEFTPGGDLVRTFGSYGKGPGQFIYPVGIAVDKQGNIYVSEYGENDRIQKFSADGVFLSSWGSFGPAPGQFQRPSGICISDDDQLYVADGVNQRIVVYDLNGKLLRTIGGPGSAPGQFNYPYDVAVRGDTLYVLEYGSHRVQKLTRAGQPLASFGVAGTGDGQLNSPWRFAPAPDGLYVSDTQNMRVVKILF